MVPLIYQKELTYERKKLVLKIWEDVFGQEI